MSSIDCAWHKKNHRKALIRFRHSQFVIVEQQQQQQSQVADIMHKSPPKLCVVQQ